MIWINVIFIMGTSSFLMLIIFSSWNEKEFRALGIAILGFCINGTVWTVFLLFNRLSWLGTINIGLAGILFLMILLSGVKFFPDRQAGRENSIGQYDERNHMFSRNNLRFHPVLHKKYYSRYPDRRVIDEKIHQQPELGDPEQQFFDDIHSPIFGAAFSFLDKIRPVSSGSVKETKGVIEPEKISRVLKELARFYGAVDVGIAALNSHHLYSHAGRHSDNWGRVIKNSHRFAVVTVVAMDTGMMKQAPALPAILESSRQYVEAAKIANILAEYLRFLGKDARAHTDGNYQTLCVPLAIESGLGELGRMGILIHRIYGPCVRLSVVTTDMELISTHNKRLYVEEFCRICKKCARNCPSRSISFGDEQCSRGAVHWSIEQEKCFSYWKRTGTDCGFCIRVCPYTKPNTLFHRLVHFYISRNSINQRIALFFDDMLYGESIPVPRANPEKLFSTHN
jgi:reductive dehalogenase